MAPVQLVIFDLDGTLLNTEQLVAEVARSVVKRHGKTMTLEAIKVSLIVTGALCSHRYLEMFNVTACAAGGQWPQAPGRLGQSDSRAGAGGCHSAAAI